MCRAREYQHHLTTMGAHLRRYIAEQDPTHAALVLDESLSQIERTQQTLASAPELQPTGGPRAEAEADKGKESLPFRNKGQTKERLAARLKRDHPAIAERVAQGEFKSIRAAALAAGIVKPIRSVPTDSPDQAIRALLTP
jgi:hypothetical protein